MPRYLSGSVSYLFGHLSGLVSYLFRHLSGFCPPFPYHIKNRIMTNLWRHPGRLPSNRPGWMHFGLKRHEIPRNSPDSGRSGGFIKNHENLILRQTMPRNADFSHLNPGRFPFCWVRGYPDAKTWTLNLYQN